MGGKTVETLHLIDAARPCAEVTLDKTGNAETRYLHTPDKEWAQFMARYKELTNTGGLTTPEAKAPLASSPTLRKASRKSSSFDAFGERTDAFGQTADALSTIHRQYVGEYAEDAECLASGRRGGSA
ncbi:MAG: hypothetical protein IPO35_12275 [Uliginosibacterium sp.]|nr:hypothetical protein [Uliginosibacterium sp.]